MKSEYDWVGVDWEIEEIGEGEGYCWEENTGGGGGGGDGGYCWVEGEDGYCWTEGYCWVEE